MRLLICGIYKITCLSNGRVYIGSSKHVHRRFQDHVYGLRYQCHENSRLQKSWDKYGGASFEFKVIKLCKPEQLLHYEKFYIEKYSSRDPKLGFNLAAADRSNMSPLTKARIGASNTKTWTPERRADQAVKLQKVVAELTAEDIRQRGLSIGLGQKKSSKVKAACQRASQARSEKLKDPEARKQFRRNMSIAAKRSMEDPEAKEKRMQNLRGNQFGVMHRIREDKS